MPCKYKRLTQKSKKLSRNSILEYADMQLTYHYESLIKHERTEIITFSFEAP